MFPETRLAAQATSVAQTTHDAMGTVMTHKAFGLNAEDSLTAVRAEGRPDAPLMAIAHLGWVAAGITVTGLLLTQRRRRYWLALPVVAALLMGNDLQAALATFLAVGIILLGFLIFGRNWWGPILIIGSVVMQTLLLAPVAYTAIVLAFALFLLAALAMMITERYKALIGAERRAITSDR